MAPRARRAIAATSLSALTALSLVSAPGCAETDELNDRLSKAQYLLELRAVVADVRQSVRRFTRFEEFPSLPKLDRLLSEAVAEYGRIVDRMKSIDPPEDVADLHERFTDALGTAEVALQEADQAVRAGDLGALLSLGDEVQGLAQDLAQLRVDYSERGYDVEPRAEHADGEFAPEGP